MRGVGWGDGVGDCKAGATVSVDCAGATGVQQSRDGSDLSHRVTWLLRGE